MLPHRQLRNDDWQPYTDEEQQRNDVVADEQMRRDPEAQREHEEPMAELDSLPF